MSTHIISREGVASAINRLMVEPDGSKANQAARNYAKNYLTQFSTGLREFAAKAPESLSARQCIAIAVRIDYLVEHS